MVHVTFGLEIGGLEKLLVQYARHIAAEYQTSFICLGCDGPIGAELRNSGYEVVTLDQPSGVRPHLWWQLFRHFRRVKPDVVHSHDIRPMIYAAPAAWAAGVSRRVHTQHGRSIGDSSRQHLMVRYASRFVTDLIGVSSNVTEMTTAASWRPQMRHTVRNGIDALPYQSTRRIENPHQILCVARLSPEKGVDVLVDAMAILAHQDSRWHLNIAGDGLCRSAIKEQIERLNLDDRVTVLGSICDVAERLSETGVFVLPSHSEGVSLTLLEAMFASVPIVATAVGGTPEVIENDVTGLLVPPGDPEQMAAAISRIVQEPIEAATRVAAAANFASENFSVRTMMQRYEAIYQSGTASGNLSGTSTGAAL